MFVIPEAGSSHVCTFEIPRPVHAFGSLSPEAAQELSVLSVGVQLPRGAVLFREGELSRNVVMISSGDVKLSCTSREGKTHIHRIAMSGDVLGLSAAISERPYEMTAEAIRPTLIKSVRREDLLLLLKTHRDFALAAARVLAEEYKSAFLDARRLALSPSAAGKLATVLLNWGRSASGDDPRLLFTMALSHDELGNMVGISRETVTRELGKFRKQKLIEIRGSLIEILEPARLEKLVA